MSFATLQQLIDRYGEAMLLDLTDRANPPAGVIGAAVAERGLADASAVIEGHLAARYAMPLQTVPQILVDVCLKLWVWNLHLHTPTEKVKADYDQAMRLLRDIAKGDVRLPDSAGSEPAAAEGSGAEFTDRERDFTPETMKGFI